MLRAFQALSALFLLCYCETLHTVQASISAHLPRFQLLGGPNIASDPVYMPFVGLGTGDHSPNPENTCGFHCNLTLAWLKLGGQRLDGADSYGDEVGVELGVQAAKTDRKNVWITSKTGPGAHESIVGFYTIFNRSYSMFRWLSLPPRLQRLAETNK